MAFADAVSNLKAILKAAQAGDETVAEISAVLNAHDLVVPRYQEVFAVEKLDELTEEEFRAFLYFRNNRHWVSLQRLGPAVCEDMARLRTALGILLDESRPIRERLDEMVPVRGPAFVPRLSKAILTPILMICHPDKYGVWNQMSEGAMKSYDIWPDFGRGLPFGQRYEKVNDVLLRMRDALGVDLWTLDALWWRSEQRDGEEEITDTESKGEPDEILSVEASRFGLERHLQEFIRDNWSSIDLGRDWMIYEEDGDPEAGYEFPCDVGRIDLLAHHRSEPRWLVIELKRHQTSDQTVGQVLRYMGWVRRHLAESEDDVRGLVIAHAADAAIQYALSATSDVDLQLYEVNFSLKDAGLPN